MTTEQLLESLKKLTGPGADDERKRRVMVYTQREKNLRREAKDQAWSKERKIRAEMTQICQQARACGEESQSCGEEESQLGSQEGRESSKEEAKKARMAILDAKKMGLQTPMKRKELKKIVKWERYKTRKEAKSKSNGNIVEPTEEADVDTMEAGKEAQGATFQLPIREK
ncbi:69d21cf0-a97c-4ede-befe-54ae504cea94 [Sclerotinia trifoliorum]|uniref:69d21cf0-a97c-4ede-befe-54ae504cea94 n=1 Tax=Sclerotinia trifoliorum TaxID=28548 RepID=A0A8H2VVY4_9HELO|nr:69d21cf0-a97c-4ede-befe-54ae504cea94 [Sclerotinia trifoliorum]